MKNIEFKDKVIDIFLKSEDKFYILLDFNNINTKGNLNTVDITNEEKELKPIFIFLKKINEKTGKGINPFQILKDNGIWKIGIENNTVSTTKKRNYILSWKR